VNRIRIESTLWYPTFWEITTLWQGLGHHVVEASDQDD